MTIEDRVRRVLTDAVATEPPPRAVPLPPVRRRRRGPVLTGAVALLLVLAAVVGLAAVRSRPRPLPTVPTTGWKTYTDAADNLRFRYPPDWRAELLAPERLPGVVGLVPPELAGADARRRHLVIVDIGRRYWIGEDWFGTTNLGRLPGGQAYLRSTVGPRGQYRATTWSVDWGRPCQTGDRRCVPWGVRVSLYTNDPQLYDRYRRVAETIVTTLEPLRPVAPSTGDPSLPACRAGQWRLLWPEEYAGARGDQGIAVQGGVVYLRGPRCHLRTTVRMTVEDASGRPLPVAGNPASMALELDLPVDSFRWISGSWGTIGVMPMWRFIWDEWCNAGLPKATLRVSADGAAGIAVPGLDPAAKPPDFGSGCVDRGRPSTVAAWP